MISDTSIRLTASTTCNLYSTSMTFTILAMLSQVQPKGRFIVTPRVVFIYIVIMPFRDSLYYMRFLGKFSLDVLNNIYLVVIRLPPQRRVHIPLILHHIPDWSRGSTLQAWSE